MAESLHIRWTVPAAPAHIRWDGVGEVVHERWSPPTGIQPIARTEAKHPSPVATPDAEVPPVVEPAHEEAHVTVQAADGVVHERWTDNAHGTTGTHGAAGAHGADGAHGGFHFDFDSVRAHHTMPYPAIEWFHGHPVVIFNLAGYAKTNMAGLQTDAAFASADIAPYLTWATKVVNLEQDGYSAEHLAQAMAVADTKDWFTFPQTLSFLNNQTFFGSIALVLLAALLFIKRPKAGQIKPQGVVQHMLEAVVLFVRDDVVRPNLKGPAAHGHGGHGHDDHGHAAPAHGDHATPVVAHAYADRWVPHFAAIFLAILAFNLIGLIPGGGSASGNPGVTVAFAVTTLVTMLLFGFKEQGFVRFWINLVPVHWTWKPMDMLVWCLLFVIEFMGLLIKPAALAIRLAANMFAGHTALLAFTALGFIIFASDQSQHGLSVGLGAVGWVVAVALYFLELLVAFIQAYIFTLLSAIFIGSSIHPEH